MPIYAYRCSHCGHAQDVLQRMSDPVLSVCPACGQSTYVKQVTAAGFQLKGSGWYVTDFRGDKKAAPAADADKPGAKEGDAASGAAAKSGEATAGGDAAAKNGGDAGKKPDAAPTAAAAPSSAPAPAAPAAPAATGKSAD
jgi:putative FmdB family regulatory protein